MPFPYQLKIKIKSLAAEARIIKHAEMQAKKNGQTSRLTSLHLHRINVVRCSSRAAQLAYGYLRGKRYDQIEQDAAYDSSKSIIKWSEVEAMVKKYGSNEQWLALPCWMPEARAHDIVRKEDMTRERIKYYAQYGSTLSLLKQA